MHRDLMKPKILAVDDDEIGARFIQDTLEPDYDVEIARNGGDALARLSPSYAALITDFRMPGMSGGELAQKARDERAYQGGIIIVTARPEDVGAYFEGNGVPRARYVDAVVPKPFSPAALVRAVEQYARLTETGK